MKLLTLKNANFFSSSAKNGFPILLLTLALLLTGATFSLLMRDLYKSRFTQTETDKKILKIAELRGRIIHLNEVLTMSAKMAATTGNLEWEERYREYKPQLGQAVKEAKELAPNPEDNKSAAPAAEADLQVFETEDRAFEAVRRRVPEEAQGILFSSEYEAQRKIYDDRMEALDKELENYQRTHLVSRTDVWQIILVVATLGFSLVAWLAVIRNLLNSRKKFLAGTIEKEQAMDALWQSEIRFGQIINNANDIIFTTDLAEHFTSFNKAGEIASGYSRDEIMKMTIPEIISPESIETVRQMLREKLRIDVPTKYEAEIVKKNGSRVTIEVNSKLLIENGTPVGIQGIARDVTESRQIAENKRKSEQYQNLFKHANDAIVIFEPKNETVLEVNDRACEMYRRRREDFVGLSIKEITQNPQRGVEALKKMLANGSAEEFESVHLRGDKTPFDITINAAVIEYQGEPAILSIHRDITTRKQSEAALRESEYKLRTLLDSMREGLLQVNNEEVIEFVNDRFCEMTGYARKELLGKTTYEMFLGDEEREIIERANRQRLEGISGQYEMRLRKKTGEELWVIVGGAPIVNAEGVITGSMGIHTDITERKQIEEQLLHDALHDGLTGLANRNLFMDHLRMTIERSKRHKDSLSAVLFLDFDRFKVINDSLGHTEGDNFLKLVARRLEAVLRAGDLLARLGGDEFTILLSELASEDEAVQIAERIQNDLKNPFELGGSEIFVTASIGIILTSPRHEKAEDLLRDADIAMYRAKAKGRAQCQIFDNSMHSQATAQLKIETEMRRALEQQEFRVYYQPIMDLKTSSLVGFEALIRWQHPKRGLLPPGEFIPAAEENGLILPLGRWILDESCRQLKAWQNANLALARLIVSVNLSSKQFLQADLAEQIAETLKRTKLTPCCLKLEITESHVMENSETAGTMLGKLRQLGIELSLDDFGTGYSSLSYLHRLPVDYLKIDRSFISRMIESKENGEIIYTIIKLAQNLKMKVIAEGIETAAQLEHLKNLNCEFGQGYFFSKPVDAAAAEIFIYQNFNNSFQTLNSLTANNIYK